MKIMIEQKAWQWCAYLVYSNDASEIKYWGETPQEALNNLLKGIFGKDK